MNKSKIITFLEMLVLAAAGLILVIFPTGSLHTAVVILGVALLVFGVFSVLSFVLKKDKEQRSVLKLILGVIAVAFGIVVLARTDLVMNFFPTIAGLLVLAGGIFGIVSAFKSRKDDSAWKSTLALSLATVVLGAVMLITRFEENTVVRMLGAVLLYIGAVGMVPGEKDA